MRRFWISKMEINFLLVKLAANRSGGLPMKLSYTRGMNNLLKRTKRFSALDI